MKHAGTKKPERNAAHFTHGRGLFPSSSKQQSVQKVTATHSEEEDGV